MSRIETPEFESLKELETFIVDSLEGLVSFFDGSEENIAGTEDTWDEKIHTPMYDFLQDARKQFIKLCRRGGFIKVGANEVEGMTEPELEAVEDYSVFVSIVVRINDKFFRVYGDLSSWKEGTLGQGFYSNPPEEVKLVRKVVTVYE